MVAHDREVCVARGPVEDGRPWLWPAALTPIRSILWCVCEGMHCAGETHDICEDAQCLTNRTADCWHAPSVETCLSIANPLSM